MRRFAKPNDVAKLMEALGATPSTPYVMTFIAGRYPYTYAYDYLREMNGPVGSMSRADCAGAVGRWCEQSGVDKDSLCVMLADLYIDRHAIDAPRELRIGAILARFKS